jgi:hypothetical protein
VIASADEGSGATDAGEAAIEYLQSQLKMATDAYDNLDRKASLLPPFLVGAAGILIGPAGVRFTAPQAVILVLALAIGTAAGYYSIEALRTRKLTAGPDPKDVADKMGRPLAEFRPALAGVIAEAIQGRRDELSEKARAFNRAVRLAAVSLLLVAIARLLGGVFVADSVSPDSSSQPSAAPTAAPATAPASPSESAPAPTERPTAPPTAPAQASPTAEGEEPLSFAMAHEFRALTLNDGGDIGQRSGRTAAREVPPDKSEQSDSA